MHHLFAPVLAALGALVYLAQRMGLLARPWVRVFLFVLGAGAAIAASIQGGMDLSELGRLKLVLATATALIVALRALGLSALRPRRVYVVTLSMLAAVSWLVYFNFFSFHGARTYLHIHDVAHYYLGSKYFPELGYGRLYTAMLRAEAEVYDNRFRSLEARDLDSGGLYDIRALLVRSDPVKARFSEPRWKDFCLDVAYFREAMGKQYGEILRDHGFNPTPVWALIGGSLAQLVPAGSGAGILALSLIDPLLEALLFLLVAWTFGLEASLLAQIYFTVFYGASFGWTGGAFLRHLWLFGLVVGICSLRANRRIVAGSLLALSTGLRVFPAAVVVALACRAARESIATRRISSSTRRLFGSFALTGLILFGATAAILPRGVEHWSEFRVNMQRHLQNTAFNTVGLSRLLAWRGADQPTDEPSYQAVLQRQEWTRRVVLFTALPLIVLFVWIRCSREGEVAVAGMGLLLLYVGLDLAAYYYVILCLPLLARAQSALRISALFAGEAVVYGLGLFEDRDVVIYWYRNAVVALVLLDLYAIPDRPLSGDWTQIRGGSAAMLG